MHEQKLDASTLFNRLTGVRLNKAQAVIIPRCKSIVIWLQCFMAPISQSLLMNYTISSSSKYGLSASAEAPVENMFECGLHANDE